jgi:DNA-binding NarL/FixJ family response regulator
VSGARVLIADDHDVVRKGIRTILERDPRIEVLGEAANGREAVELAAELKPDVVVMDIAMPQLNGIEAAAQILRRNARTGVIIVSMYSEEAYLLRALSSGVRGYLLKESVEPDLVRAVHQVSAGRTYFSPLIADNLLHDYLQRLRDEGLEDSYGLLTDREKEVLQLLAEGKTNKEAATVLNVGVSTVETHRTNLMQKLDLHNTAEIVLYAVRKKIVS